MFPGERLPARRNVGNSGWRHAHRVGVRCAIAMEKHACNGVTLGQHSLCKSQGRKAGGRSRGAAVHEQGEQHVRDALLP